MPGSSRARLRVLPVCAAAVLCCSCLMPGVTSAADYYKPTLMAAFPAPDEDSPAGDAASAAVSEPVTGEVIFSHRAVHVALSGLQPSGVTLRSPPCMHVRQVPPQRLTLISYMDVALPSKIRLDRAL